ncbi:MAG TPA: hypothetical protein VE075_06005 [Thermoanaerobaculia bacterium]|nr:hypothetical protein [Thermoanaerobaculia bacterium]
MLLLFLLLVSPPAAMAQSAHDDPPQDPVAAAARRPHESPTRIWFHPLPSPAAWPGGHPRGSQDFLALFKRNAAWPRAMAHVGVVGMYAGWIIAAGDQELHQVVAFLNGHGMGIEIEAPALQAQPACGSGVEGYVPWELSLHDFTLTYLYRLKALGARVLFVKVDEPFFFGSVTGDPRACHLPVSEVALAVGQYARLVKTVYPDAAIGDVEPIIAGAYAPDVRAAIAQWHDTYQAVTGAPFPFFFADVDFSDPQWPAIVKALEGETRHRGTRFGIIYTGDEQDAADDEWADKAVARFQTYEGGERGRPDYVLFQSWEPHPVFCLPESDPTTFTSVIDAYVSATIPKSGAGR